VDHRTFSQKGGRARSLAKTIANRSKAAAYWEAVRSGKRRAPRRTGPHLDPEAIARLLSGFCGQRGIVLLEIFGPVARGDRRPGAEVELLATFSSDPGPGRASAEREMAGILGAPVRLLTRDSVDRMANPYRRASILADARVIFRAA
jgi:predicted nucleotidyltransferase